ncbi:MAG TPA: ribosome-associated translation inhibitor RaiA [Acidimicrobiia bacterium]|jgi:putative sigma-54 modulation protein|nr:ribosome-associated translation inhibitor RaiA [Acidimicrobiia bacterium]
MDIVVRGKNVDVSPRLRKLAREKLTKISRFTHDAGRVEVDFSELRNRRVAANQVCDVIVHLKRNFVKAHAAASEPATALDLVIDKVEHQVARIKEKRVTRSHAGRRHRGATGTGEVLAPEAAPDGDNEDDLPADRIVKTKRFTMKPMGPEEAALQMELLGHDFFLFTNAENGHAAVIYRRRDGNLGLIETSG